MDVTTETGSPSSGLHHNRRTPRLSARSDRCQCRACREFFNSTYAFDRHRVGQYGIDRRCPTIAEILSKGMAKNASGFWVAQPMPLERGGKRKVAAFAPPPCGRTPLEGSRRVLHGVTARVASNGAGGRPSSARSDRHVR